MNSTSAAEQILERFEKRARPHLNRYFELNTCIEQVRILVEVMKHFGVSAEAKGCKFLLVCKEREFQFFTGGDERDIANAKLVSKRLYKRGSGDAGYPPHVVALVERRWWVDMTVAQADCPEFNFRLKPQMVCIDLGQELDTEYLPQLTCTGMSDNDVPFEATWIGVYERDWESTPAWEPSHLWHLIDRIVADMVGAT